MLNFANILYFYLGRSDVRDSFLGYRIVRIWA